METRLVSEAGRKPVALVTGSSRGIGRAIAIALAQKGWDIVINYQNDEKAAKEAAQLAGTSGADILLAQADISIEKNRLNLVEAIQGKWGRIDLLVNNAGMAPRQRVDLLQVSEESFNEVMAANLRGTFFLTQRIANWMIALIQKGVIEQPKIVNIGSISAYTASVERSEYCISKAALAMVTALFAARLAEFGILVYELRPGIIQTDMTRVAKAKYDQLIGEGLTPVRRWGQPEDVARAVIAIAEGSLGFSTGEIINIDGGFHLRRL
jgi:3-oxoacyl-[acyl-carrier protein] reductase